MHDRSPETRLHSQCRTIPERAIGCKVANISFMTSSTLSACEPSSPAFLPKMPVFHPAWGDAVYADSLTANFGGN